MYKMVAVQASNKIAQKKREKLTKQTVSFICIDGKQSSKETFYDNLFAN